jgi:DNA polymerase III delta prime subunit
LIENVCEAEGQVLEEDVVEEIVDNAGGSARTALVLLDKALSLSPEDQIKGVQQRAEETSEAIELCRALMKNTSWVRVAKILKNLKGDPESIRYAVMGYANSVLMKKANDRARDILVAFEHNFYDSKKFGLTLACYEVIND